MTDIKWSVPGLQPPPLQDRLKTLAQCSSGSLARTLMEASETIGALAVAVVAQCDHPDAYEVITNVVDAGDDEGWLTYFSYGYEAALNTGIGYAIWEALFEAGCLRD